MLPRALMRRAACGAFFAAVFAAGARADAACRVDVSPIAFPRYEPLAGEPARGEGTVSVECTTPSNVTVTISQGTSSSVLDRSLGSEPRRMHYALFLDAAQTMLWGDGSPGTSVLRGEAAPGRPLHHLIYAVVPPGQAMHAGTYRDELFVRVEY